MTALASPGDGFTADAPVVGFHLVDDDDGGGWVFIENLDEQVSGAFDQFGFLFSRGAVLGDFNVDEWHGVPLIGRLVSG